MVRKKIEPLVSVIIPYFNMGDYIFDAIDSVIAQTHKNLEIIVVNDGSTAKNTDSILKKVAEIDPRIRVINQKNQKLPTARNNGIKVSHGEYVFCLDSDDKVVSTYVEECLSVLLKDKKIGIVTTDCQQFGEANNLWKAEQPSPALLLIRNIVHVASFFRKEIWEKNQGYDSQFNEGFEDWEFWINAVEHGYGWQVISKPLFEYRIRQNSMLAESSKKHEELYKKIVDKHHGLYQKYAGETAKITQKMIMEKDKKIVELYEFINNLPQKTKISS